MEILSGLKILKKYEHMFGEPVQKIEVHATLEPGYHTELDLSCLCTKDQVGQYQRMIGDLQWAVLLGWIEIYCDTMTIGSYREAQRIVHLERTNRVYSYLRNYKKTSIKFRTEILNYEMYES